MAQKKGRTGLFSGKKTRKDSAELPYKLRDNFLTGAELLFYRVLTEMFAGRYVVCPKVSLLNIILVVKPQVNQEYIDRIGIEDVDFLVCDSEMLKPMLGIEFYHRSHDRQKWQERDAMIKQIFDVIGLPLARIKELPTYDPSELTNYFKTVVQQSRHPARAAGAAKSVTGPGSGETEPGATRRQAERLEEFKTQVPDCPNCHIPMVLRRSQTNKLFYGCTNHPGCKEAITLDQFTR